jgi:AraC family transcriptional regulator
MAISDVAYDCGFSSPATFARAFRDRFGMSASEWIGRQPYFAGNSKICKADSNIGKSDSNSGKLINSGEDYFAAVFNYYSQTYNWSSKMNVEFKELPSRKLAYVAHIGPYEHESIGQAWNKLCGWAGPAGLLNDKSATIGISFDDPEVTDPSKCRYYACVECPESVTPPEGMGVYNLRGGRHAVYRFVGKPEQIKDAYGQLFAQSISENGWQPGDSPCYEQYYETPEENKDGNFVMDICCPVKPL